MVEISNTSAASLGAADRIARAIEGLTMTFPVAIQAATPQLWVGGEGYETVQTAIATIGSTEAMLHIPQGDWAFTADCTVPANITLVPERKAKFNISTGVTLTINGGFEAGLFQVFYCTGTGAVAFGPGSCLLYRPEWFGYAASADGVDNQTALTALIAAMPAGGAISFMPYSANITGLATFTKACTVYAFGATLNFPANSTNQGVRATASYIMWFAGEIAGPQYATQVDTQIGFYAYGADSSNYLKGLVLQDVYIHGWGWNGIEFDFVEKYSIRNPRIEYCYYAGGGLCSCNFGEVNGGSVYHIYADAPTSLVANTYGWYISKHVGTPAVFPLPHNNTLRGIKCEEVMTHEAFDVRGIDNEVIDCHAFNCFNGFTLTEMPAASNGGTAAGPIRCKVIGGSSYVNHGTGEVITYANVGSGLTINGVPGQPATECVAIGVSLDGHGNTDGSWSAFYTHDTINMKFDGTIKNSGLIGISFQYGHIRARMTGVIDNLAAASGGCAVDFLRGSGTANVDCRFENFEIYTNGTNRGFVAHDDAWGCHFYNNRMNTGGAAYDGTYGGNPLYYFGRIEPFARTSTVWNPASIASGGYEDKVVTISGMGNSCYAAVFPDRTLDGLSLSWQADTNQLTLRLNNPSASAIDLSQTTFYITVSK